MCICKNCGCKSECSYYEAYVARNLEAAEEYSASVQFSCERDSYLEDITRALENFTCDYFEEEQK